MWSEATWWRELAKLACLQLARSQSCARDYGHAARIQCADAAGNPSTVRCARCWERTLAEKANANQKEGASRL
jgi:hypothetical protein